MREAIQKLVEDYIDEIDRNDFETIFIEATENADHPEIIGEFSRVLRDAGIDVFSSESTLTFVPMGMFWFDETIDEVIIPEGIESIEMNAFTGSSVRKVNLPESLEYIADDAFSNCNNLKELTFPSRNLTSIAFGQFERTPIENIYYTGTLDEWNNVESAFFSYGTKLKVVHCTDGDAEIR